MEGKRHGNRSRDSMYELSDDDLVEQLASDSKAEKDAATKEFYRRYRGIVFVIIQSRLGNADRAEEVTQEIMLEALQKIGNYRRGSDSAFRSWIKTIAHRRAVDAYRGERGGRRTKITKVYIDGMEDWEKESVLSKHAEEGATKEERDAQLAQAIGMLPERLRTVVQLTLDGKQTKEIGATLGVGASRVSQLLAEAREQLRKRMLREE